MNLTIAAFVAGAVLLVMGLVATMSALVEKLGLAEVAFVREEIWPIETVFEELGQEGFVTSLRLGGRTVEELKRIVFAPPPADD